MNIKKQNFKLAALLILTSLTLQISTSAFSQSVGISGEYFAIDSSAILELKDTRKGLLMTRLTTLQRDSICIGGAACYGYKPAEGLVIFNTTTKCYEGYVGSSWMSIACYDPCGGIKTLTDSRDGNTYPTVVIGDQCWMAENLNYGTYVTAATGQGGAGTQKYCYNNDTSKCTVYGGLYEWAEMMNGSSSCNGTGESQPACSSPIQGICPSGWHLPSHYEWTALERAVCSSGSCATDFPYDATTTFWRGTNEGQKLAGNESLWIDGILDVSGAGTSPFGDSGFDALPGGISWSGSFDNLFDGGNYGRWWSATEDSSTSAWPRSLNSGNSKVKRDLYQKLAGMSVRCVKD